MFTCAMNPVLQQQVRDGTSLVASPTGTWSLFLPRECSSCTVAGKCWLALADLHAEPPSAQPPSFITVHDGSPPASSFCTFGEKRFSVLKASHFL